MLLQQQSDFLESPDLALKKRSWTHRAQKIRDRAMPAPRNPEDREAFEDFAKELEEPCPGAKSLAGKMVAAFTRKFLARYSVAGNSGAIHPVTGSAARVLLCVAMTTTSPNASGRGAKPRTPKRSAGANSAKPNLSQYPDRWMKAPVRGYCPETGLTRAAFTSFCRDAGKKQGRLGARSRRARMGVSNIAPCHH